MKLKKLVMECGIFAAAFAAALPATVSVSAAQLPETVSVYETDRTYVALCAGNEDTSSQNASEGTLVGEDEKQLTRHACTEEEMQYAENEDSEWEDRLLIVVDEDSSLCIREEASADSEVVGMIERGGSAEIIEKGSEWTKIQSGDVTGYVKNEFCLFEEEAAAQAEEICESVADVTQDGLRIRMEASTEASILAVVYEGETLTVADTKEETAEGWVAVEYNGEIGYVSAEYVEVSVETLEAQSMEEILEERAAEEAAAAAAQAASSASASSSSGSTSSSSTSTGSSSSSVSTSDLTLLAALIECEAGGESYAGKLAVGAVVMNRVNSSSFPNTISGVIYQSGQFSPASNGKLSSTINSGSISSSSYTAAQAAINGEDNTGGAKYFRRGSSGGTVIGNQVFY